MPSIRIGATTRGRRAWGAFLLTVLAVVAPRALRAEPLRGFEGEYVIVRPQVASGLGVNSAPSSLDFSNGTVTVRESLGHDTHVVTLASVAGAQGLLSGEGRKVVDLDPKDETCERLVREGLAKACSPNFEVRVNATPNDPSFGSLWGLSAAQGIDAPRAWDLSTGSSSVIVAVIDTGIDYNHQDLANNMWTNPQEVAGNGIDDDSNGYIDDVYGVNTIAGAASPGNQFDDHGHGTHVGGTIGAEGNNGVGVVGVMQQVKLMGLKFLASNGSGSTGDAIKAIDYLVAMKERGDVPVRVVNNSWGGGGYSAPLKAAIERANDAGIIFVVAAGNSNSNTDANPSYPASYEVPNVVAVAAISSAQQKASFSNYGATSVHIAAPGVGILSTTPGNSYQSLNGTSMAAPHVTGALGLLFAYAPSLTNAQAVQRLYEAGREIPGLVNSSTGLRYVSTKRTLDVARMLHNETSPVPGADSGSETCAYAVQTSNLLLGGEIDTSADSAALVNNSDEGGYYALDLPFDFQLFSGTIRRLWVSPNGVLYKASPLGYDYTPRDRAPLDSIAAFHSDLTPRSGSQGVRVFSSKDKVTIAWSSEVYSYSGFGVVTTRASLLPSGEFSVSVQFSEVGSIGSLRRPVMGDPFSTPIAYPQAAMGISGPAPSNAYTVDLLSTLASLGISSSSDVILGARYTPLCSAGVPNQDPSPPEAAPGQGGGEGGPGEPSVRSVRLRRVSSGKQEARITRFNGSIRGSGSADFPVTVHLDRQECSGRSSVSMINGSGSFSVQVPSSVSRLGVSFGGYRASVFLPRALGGGSRLSARGRARACRAVLRTLR